MARVVQISLCCLVCASHLGAQTFGPRRNSPEPHVVYVAEFVSRQVGDRTVLASFTELYETALIESRRYQVLNRRTFQQILAEAQNETAVRTMSDLNSSARARLASVAGADGVIFGEVVDDAGSGEVIVSVTLESFDSVKHWKYDTTMKRGRLSDRDTRAQAAKALVTAMTNGSGSGLERMPTGPSTSPVVPSQQPSRTITLWQRDGAVLSEDPKVALVFLQGTAIDNFIRGAYVQIVLPTESYHLTIPPNRPTEARGVGQITLTKLQFFKDGWREQASFVVDLRVR